MHAFADLGRRIDQVVLDAHELTEAMLRGDARGQQLAERDRGGALDVGDLVGAAEEGQRDDPGDLDQDDRHEASRVEPPRAPRRHDHLLESERERRLEVVA